MEEISIYINLLTNEVISDESVVSETANGITVFSNNCWKFLPNGYYEKKEGKKVTFTYLPASLSGMVVDGAIPPDTTEEKQMTYYAHYFGLNHARAGYMKFAQASSIVSQPMETEPFSPLSLRASFHCVEGTSVEFYIVDGTNEAPILPEGQQMVIHEKRFPGLEPRFHGTNFVYYRDNKEIENDDIGIDGSVYTVSYKPDISAYTYTPAKSSVKVKVLFRIYDESAAAPYVEDLMIVQGGGQQ